MAVFHVPIVASLLGVIPIRWMRVSCLRMCEGCPGYAKTNNRVEKFNKGTKRDYSRRLLVSVNALAQSYLDMCYHRACRARPFATTPCPSDVQATRYRALQR
jgi:hypothetical protein